MHLHLFGAQTPTGEAFKQQFSSAISSRQLFLYSRRDPSLYFADFLRPNSFRLAGDPGAPSILISFAPIWLLAPFLEQLALVYPDRLDGLRGVIACSSSSTITKRFASNLFDHDLVARLTSGEDKIIATCRRLNLPCSILRPTLIYGRVGPYMDRNLSRLIKFMRRLPLLLLPAHTGLRQPIHATQLAAVTHALVQQIDTSCFDPLYQCFAIGGDVELSYASMLRSLQNSLPSSDPARCCHLLSIPNRLFYAASSPLLLRSPKVFEAVLRLGADLSGFMPTHKFLQVKPQAFPVLPLL